MAIASSETEAGHTIFKHSEPVKVPPFKVPGAQKYKVELEALWRKDYLNKEGGARPINILHEMKLYEGILSPEEQRRLLDDIETQLDLAKQRLPPYNGSDNCSYQPPPVTRLRIGRHTLQYGCAFEIRNTPKCPNGIKPEREVASMPVCLTNVLERMYEKGLFSDDQRPDSATIDIFNQGDCMPPHSEHQDFLRPIFTLTLGSDQQQRIVMGQKVRVREAGQFESDVDLAIPNGSVLARQSHSANVPKLAVPSVSSHHVRVTFRKMRPQFS